MPRKYIYRKQMSGLLDFHGFREQTEEFLNGIGDDIGDLSSLTTSAKTNLVAAINEAAQSGGDGAEENFQQVYTTTLAEASDTSTFTITKENIGGKYVDVVVYVDSPGFGPNDYYAEQIGADFYEEESDQDPLTGIFCQMLAEVPSSHATHTTLGIVSLFGLMCVQAATDEEVISDPPVFLFGFDPSYGAGGLYPTADKTGISKIDIFLAQGSGSAVFPAGTKFTVYARRRVTTAE